MFFRKKVQPSRRPVRRLKEIKPFEVDLVGSPAIGKPFTVIKNCGGGRPAGAWSTYLKKCADPDGTRGFRLEKSLPGAVGGSAANGDENEAALYYKGLIELAHGEASNATH